MKMDDLAILINDKITRRGIAKGLVFVQADLNKNILVAEKKLVQALLTNNFEERGKIILQVKQIMKIVSLSRKIRYFFRIIKNMNCFTFSKRMRCCKCQEFV